ncbi:MAG: SagB/ThcOx family dehydrogenase [Smithella sp.]
MNHFKDKLIIYLPSSVQKGTMTLEECLRKRESIRDFSSEPLKREDLSQLLWSAQGITRNWGGKTCPSAGALYPLEIYVVMNEGVFHYSPQAHNLIRIILRDVRKSLSEAALGQDCIREAPAVFIITSVYERVLQKYGNRTERYINMEVGHAGQNILLQAVSLGLAAVPIGAFHDEQVKQVLNLHVNHEPLYLIPVGKKR